MNCIYIYNVHVFFCETRSSSQVSMLISYHDGLVESTQFERVRNLPSVVFLEENLQAGRQVEKTIDLFSLIGMCVLVHEDPKADVVGIRGFWGWRGGQPQLGMLGLSEKSLIMSSAV